MLVTSEDEYKLGRVSSHSLNTPRDTCKNSAVAPWNNPRDHFFCILNQKHWIISHNSIRQEVVCCIRIVP
ncbi:hypothetical protein COCON_G00186410 [Conger conger]|uniref:Uncharacterized protein n=1 Tax=Conger conger TaxID=82655 RepID=A0A9Q1HRJ1_CONCO|nr:hypothetical protein COCON_G00186410 [Conger conger]